MSDYRYTEADRATIYRVVAERRDMRHFIPGPVTNAQLAFNRQAAHRAPSVGLMEPQ